MSFDYSAPAELFLAKRTKNGCNNYRRFTTAAEAIRYAIEDLRTPKAFGAWLEVGDERFNNTDQYPRGPGSNTDGPTDHRKAHHRCCRKRGT